MVSAGNLPNWGGQTTTTQPQPVQQPRQPLVSEPAPISAQTVQSQQPRTWTAPTSTSSPTVSTPTQQVQPRPVATVVAGTGWSDWSELAWDATKIAVNTYWIPQAKIQNVTINAVSATCGVRCIQGPDLDQRIRSILLSGDVPVAVADVFANAIAGALKDWQDSLTIPGLSWYPAFAAYPGPQAPPTPNIPTPLIALRSARQTELTSSERLASRIFEQFRGTTISPEARDAIQQFSQMSSKKFLTWITSAQVMNVLGQGTVPTFAPPTIPVGPVVAGNVIPRPGNIIGKLR